MATRTVRSHSRKALTFAGSVALTALIALATGRAAAGEIQWRSAPAQEAVKKASVAQALSDLAARPMQSRAVLRFRATVDGQLRSALEDAGITLLAYLGNNAFFARLQRDRLQAEDVERMGVLTGAEPIDPFVKLHPILVAGETPEWAVVGHTPDGTPIIGTYVAFHRDVDLGLEGVPLMDLYQADVRDLLEPVNALVVELPLDAVFDLAAEDAVQWIEQALPRFSMVNNSNRALVQADEVQAPPYDLDGAGVNVLVYDGGTARPTHQDFGGRCFVRDASGMHDHSTHVAATVGGSGIASGGAYKGMAPGVTIQSYGFEWDGSGVFLYNNPGDLLQDYDEAIDAYGAVIANNSIGTNTALYWDCEITGDYGITSQLIDTIVRGDGSSGLFTEPFRVVFANGNERQSPRCGDTYYTTAPPAGAKNHITAGAVNSNDDSITWFTSWGPVDDGRIKPDITAPGSQTNEDNGVTSASSSGDTAYTVKSGTSMASPTVCGVCALIMEDFRNQFPGQPDPRNSTLKILLAHAAADRGNVGPDNQFGYGSIRAKDTIDFMRLGHLLEEEVDQDGVAEFRMVVSPGSEVKVTLAWDDFPGTPNVVPSLINDLDLQVYDPSGTRHYPWTLDPANPGDPATRDQEDHVNNIEQVVVDDPMAGEWTVQVAGTVVPEGPQVFSICASAEFGQTGVSISFPSGLPGILTPGEPTSFDVRITAYDELVVPGSPTLHFRYAGETWFSKPLGLIGPDLYRATLPPPVCEAIPEFYISAEGTLSGLVTSPPNAPDGAYTALVGIASTPVSDNFETDQGWTVTNIDLEDGQWDRGVPIGGGDRGDPPTDYDGSGKCWLTDNEDGNSDVDGGPTILTSPAYDITGLDNVALSYAAWFYNDDHDQDNLTVEVSDDDGANWVTVEVLGHIGTWVVHQFDVTDFVSLTAEFRIRFSAIDNPNDSVTEAGVDRFQIDAFSCGVVLDDCNENGILDSDDIASGRSEDINGNGIPDECESVGCPGDINFDGVIDLADLSQLLTNYGMSSGATFEHGDLDNDGDVDLEDLAALLSVYGEPCP